jgi:hypothetical protein
METRKGEFWKECGGGEKGEDEIQRFALSVCRSAVDQNVDAIVG